MREYIESLEAAGQLKTVSREVDPRFELAAVTLAAQQRDDLGLLFQNVSGTQFPVATNLYNSRRRLCDLIGAPDGGLCERWNEIQDICENSATDTSVLVDRPDDLVEGRLGDLPLITYHGLDAGAYLTSPIFLAKDPDTGVPNLSFHRCMYVSDDELRIRLGSSHDLADYQRRAEARNEPVEAAILVGVHPALFLAAGAPLPPDGDELSLATAISGQATRFYPALGLSLDIPVSTQFVIEGKILPNERRPEAPFGEFMGFYVPEEDNHVFEVSAVYWRENPIFHSILCGSREDLCLIESLTAARTWRHLNSRLPGIIDVSCAPAFLNTTVKIRKEYEDHPRDVIMAAIDAHQDYNKAVFVVDEDVDFEDMNEVVKDFLTKGRADKRVIVIEDKPGFYRDPHKDHYGRLGVDCTAPFGREDEFIRKHVPGAEEIDLDDYID